MNIARGELAPAVGLLRLADEGHRLNLAYYSDTVDGAKVSRVPRPVSSGRAGTGVEPEHTGLRALRRRPQSTRRDKPRRGTCCPCDCHCNMQGSIGGVGLDVFDHENELANALRSGRTLDTDEFRATRELATRPNVIMTPHNAFNTREALERKCRTTCRQIQNFIKHGVFLWRVP